MYKFRNTNHTYNPNDESDRNDLQTFFESNVSIYNNLFFLITLLFNVYFGHLCVQTFLIIRIFFYFSANLF